ncbi:hypothetical protein BROUX41_002930 [Berkeleyomyces rouxiae]|uniref:uncharacterized protein n=1 Tax=Berkeleyomyces rouxiae TaxID=2035830 RepID=UPI003B78C1A0
MAGESDKENAAQQTLIDSVDSDDKVEEVDPEDEPDPWDVRINDTGCAAENTKLTDCWHDTKDWRKCTAELMEFQICWKKNKNDVRTSMTDA